MENPFELIIEKLNAIEDLLKETKKDSRTSEVLNSSLPDVLNLKQASEYISLSKSAIYKKTAERSIPHFKQGKKLYFKTTDLSEWMTKLRISTKEEIEKEGSEYIMRKHKFK